MVEALAGQDSLEVEPIVPLPAEALRQLSNLSRRSAGAQPWPPGLQHRLRELKPIPTLVPYVPVPGRSLQSAAASVSLHLFKRPVHRRPNLLLGSMLAEAGFVAAKSGAALGVPAIAVGHGSDIRAYLNPAFDEGRAKRATYAVAHARQTLVVAKAFVSPLADRGVSAKVVPFTSPAALFPLAKHKRRGLLFVGRCSRAKGVDQFLETVAQLPGETATLVGPPSDDFNVPKNILDMGLKERVEWVGEVPQVRLGEYYNRAECFVLPSKAEGLPCVLVEALLSGCPVVASAVDGVPELVTESVGGTYAEGDEVALRNTVRRVLEGRRKRRYSPPLLRQWAERFSTETASAELTNIISALV